MLNCKLKPIDIQIGQAKITIGMKLVEFKKTGVRERANSQISNIYSRYSAAGSEVNSSVMQSARSPPPPVNREPIKKFVGQNNSGKKENTSRNYQDSFASTLPSIKNSTGLSPVHVRYPLEYVNSPPPHPHRKQGAIKKEPMNPFGDKTVGQQKYAIQELLQGPDLSRRADSLVQE